MRVFQPESSFRANAEILSSRQRLAEDCFYMQQHCVCKRFIPTIQLLYIPDRTEIASVHGWCVYVCVCGGGGACAERESLFTRVINKHVRFLTSSPRPDKGLFYIYYVGQDCFIISGKHYWWVNARRMGNTIRWHAADGFQSPSFTCKDNRSAHNKREIARVVCVRACVRARARA